MAVARELGIEVPLSWWCSSSSTSPRRSSAIRSWSTCSHQKRPFTALVSFNDIAAIGAIRGFRDQNLRVPEDVSIVGFDDIQGAAFHNPSLTTIRQPLRSMGTTAAQILLQRLRGQKDDPDHMAIVPELIIRESTMPPNPKRIPRHG